MLDYNILSQKKKVTVLKDNKPIEMIDLLSNTYRNYNINEGKFIIVNKYYIARPDLISLACYGDDKYADIICKVNGISNPFELNEDMLIFIPSMTEISNLYVGGIASSDILDSYLANSKSSRRNKNNKKYQSLQEQVNKTVETIGKRKTNNQKLKNERRSPSEQVITDNNYYIDRSLGLVIY